MATEQLHPDLHPLLLEFQGVNGYPLKAVWHVYQDECLDKVVLEFDQVALAVEAEPSDDTIVVHRQSNSVRHSSGWIDVSQSTQWNAFIGKSFGWGWIIINQQDALDRVLLSFDGIVPQVMLIVMASSIHERIIGPG